ncbi:ash family protein [Scandinavium sp. M-37]|uniref:ash family protein n=1 Tax=Scandinavium sp. M-37 TaxID=3373077 RepID=UPI0037450A9E
MAKSTAGFRSPKLTLRTHIFHNYVLRLRSSVKRIAVFVQSMVAQAGQPSGWPGHLQGNRYCEPCLSYHQSRVSQLHWWSKPLPWRNR